jgi:predicted nucleic acid-binding protein
MDKVFIDSDIILDLLLERQPFHKHAVKLLAMISKNQITGYVSPLIFSNLYYIIRKLRSKQVAKDALKKLRILLKILPIDEKIIDQALNSDFTDFEDAIKYYTAIENKLKVLLTRNKQDYKKANILILNAEEYLAML